MCMEQHVRWQHCKVQSAKYVQCCQLPAINAHAHAQPNIILNFTLVQKKMNFSHETAENIDRPLSP